MFSLRDDISLEPLRVAFSGLSMADEWTQRLMFLYARYELHWSHQKSVQATERLRNEAFRDFVPVNKDTHEWLKDQKFMNELGFSEQQTKVYATS